MGQGSSSVGKEDISRQADHVVQALKDKGVKCVAFDMDQTLVARHSRGNLRRKNYDWFKGHVTEAFVELVPRLSSAGIKLAVATASDREEYRLKGTNSTTHMLGEDLVLPLLQDVVPDHAAEFFVVAYNPRARGAEGRMAENKGKLRHIRLTCEHYGIPEENLLLLDDENGNHSVHKRSNSKFYSVKVDGNKGMQLSTLLAQVGSLPPSGGVVSLPSFLDMLLASAP